MKYTPDNDELLAAITAEMQRLTAADKRGRAPSRTVWDVRRAAHLPCANYLIQRFGAGWPAVVEMADCTPARKWQRHDGTIGGVVTQATGLGDDIEQHIANGATPAHWMDRFANSLAFTTEQPLRIERVRGHTVGGQPCIITREYWMVR